MLAEYNFSPIKLSAVAYLISTIIVESKVVISIRSLLSTDSKFGTLITNNYIGLESKIEIIAGSDKVSCLEVHETQMVGEVGFDLKIMEVLKKHNVSYISKMTNANTIDMIINEDDCTKELVKDLEKRFQAVSFFKAAIVCAIGSNIAKPGIMAAATKALADEKINVLAFSQTSRQTNMQFILEREDYKMAQRALHRALCE